MGCLGEALCACKVTTNNKGLGKEDQEEPRRSRKFSLVYRTLQAPYDAIDFKHGFCVFSFFCSIFLSCLGFVLAVFSLKQLPS